MNFNNSTFNILYDHQILTLQKFGGISRYFHELKANMPDNISFHQSGYNKLLFDTEFIWKRTILDYVHKTDSVSKILKSNYDIFHPTYYDPYFLNFNKKPFVLTVHDLAHETFPLLFKNDPIIKFKKKIIYKADHIIAISEFTKNELLKFYKNLNPYKISVIYHGCSLPEYIKSFKDDINCFDYFLYTGNRGGYKNFIPLIKSISHLLIKYNIKLICTGLKFTKNELLLFNEYNISDLLIHKFANDIELSNLYSNAIAFIFPSYYEGFGLPILECFNYGCPLLISNTSCFPEIANDAALYFDPYNAEDIYKKVESIILDFSLRNSLIINGKKRLKLFDWSKTSLLTSNIYESLL